MYTLLNTNNQPILNTMHPLDYKWNSNQCELFAHKSEQLAKGAELEEVMFLIREDSGFWNEANETDVNASYNDCYYWMAKTIHGDQLFYAPDLEGISFYWNSKLFTVVRITEESDGSATWALKPMREMPAAELPKGNFWAN